jgi:hypothetical protein
MFQFYADNVLELILIYHQHACLVGNLADGNLVELTIHFLEADVAK